jgi:hypothetical protein
VQAFLAYHSGLRVAKPVLHASTPQARSIKQVLQTFPCPRRGRCGVRHEKIRRFTTPHQGTCSMDAERINLIGSRLTDLSARTLDLWGYL